MAATSLIAATTIIFEIIPIMCHRLITNPYPESNWDSIIVSSDPITIKEKKDNEVADPKLNRPLKPQKRSFEECPENDFKCLYGDSEDKSSNQIVNRFIEQYSNIANVNFAQDERNQTEETENENSRKSYWSMVDTQTHNHPYNDKNGWVTLDPVPWSTSKISKWQPNKVGVYPENRPWGYGPTTHRPVQQFWVSGSSLSSQRPTSQWGIGSNDIITDNKPSDFPTGDYNTYGNPSQGNGYHPENEYYGYTNNYQEFHQNQGYKGGNHPSKLQQNTHPSTYPSNGNGEWVHLSTTKGYSVPQRNRWSGPKTDERVYGSRKIKPDLSRYHEEDLTEKQAMKEGGSTSNRKSDEESTEVTTQIVQKGNENNTQITEKTPLQVLYTGSPKGDQPVRTIRRKVRLQVLPSLKNSSTSHGGLLEVDSNSQTVDEAQQEDEKLKNLKAIANVKKSKIRGYKLVPVSKVTGKGMSNKTAMTLAAVGAGMIPATMALLVPLALGRKRRSLYDRREKTALGKENVLGGFPKVF